MAALFIGRRRDKRPSCQMIGFSEQAPGALMDSGQSGLIKQIMFDAGNSQAVLDYTLLDACLCDQAHPKVVLEEIRRCLSSPGMRQDAVGLCLVETPGVVPHERRP